MLFSDDARCIEPCAIRHAPAPDLGRQKRLWVRATGNTWSDLHTISHSFALLHSNKLICAAFVAAVQCDTSGMPIVSKVVMLEIVASGELGG